ncbi:YqeG family HAD IIIA-type phosphatase [Candidatus Woesearchaeota archaeon]|nr:YqeG family HAD IIIA-type phosphatase [Candidatus Woesearchaeota archaeon]
MAQMINFAALGYFPVARFFRKELSIPHFQVPDISYINPERLKQVGIKGLVFDKDNTLTAPYGREIYPTIRDAFEEYKRVFGYRICIMSNSAGTRDDKGYRDARQIEDDLGIKVLRHIHKKPGGLEAVIEFFDCDPSKLAMFGDRIFTDIVFGNRYGMLTVHTAFLTESGDLKAAASVRRREVKYIEKLTRKGFLSPKHDLCGPGIRKY